MKILAGTETEQFEAERKWITQPYFAGCHPRRPSLSPATCCLAC